MKNGINFGHGSLTKNILKLSWPMMLGMLSQTLFNVVDRLYLGRYSGDALAAVGMTFPFIFLTIALAGGVGVGVNSLISRLLGANKNEEANRVAEHSVILALLISLFFSTLGIFFSRDIFIFAGAPESILDMAVVYTNIIFSGVIFMVGSFIINSILRGTGDTKNPMIMMVMATLVNIIIDPIFIFGFSFIPEMGVKGAAIATVISRSLALIYGIIFILSGKSIISISFKKFKYRFQIIKDIFKVGLPASIQQGAVSLAFFFILMMVTKYGENAIAAYTIVATLDSVSILPIIGLSTATVTIVGFNVGANKLDRAEKACWIASKLSILFGTLMGIMYFILPEFFVGFFTVDPEILAIGTLFLKILSLFTGYVAIIFIVSSAFQGAGKAMPALVLVILRMFILMLPFAYIFSVRLDLGLSYIWWAFPFSGVITATVAIFWYKAGTWKKNCKAVDGVLICE